MIRTQPGVEVFPGHVGSCGCEPSLGHTKKAGQFLVIVAQVEVFVFGSLMLDAWFGSYRSEVY